MSDEKGVWGWMGRLNNLVALLGGIGAAVLAVIGYVSGVSHGESKQRAETQENIEKLSAAVPNNQKERVNPVFQAMTAATSSNRSELNSVEISRITQSITNAVTGIPTSIFSVGSSRVFSVPELRTALVCDDRFHVGYISPTSSISMFRVSFDSNELYATPGVTRKMPNGTRLTLMHVENKAAIFDIGCDPEDDSKPSGSSASRG